MFKMRERRGFTIVDFLVVVVILAVIAGLALPALQSARQSQMRKLTMDNMRKCATAVNLAYDTHKTIPPYYGTYAGREEPLTFHAHLLPFLDGMAPVYNEKPTNGKATVPVYLSELDPSRTDGGAGAVNFAVNLRLFYTKGGLGELATGDKVIRLKWGMVSDGTSNTLLFASKYQVCGDGGGSKWLDPGHNAVDSLFAATFGASTDLWQRAPLQSACNPTAGTAVSFSLDEIIVVHCDASVSTLKSTMDPKVWRDRHDYNALPFEWTGPPN